MTNPPGDRALPGPMPAQSHTAAWWSGRRGWNSPPPPPVVSDPPFVFGVRASARDDLPRPFPRRPMTLQDAPPLVPPAPLADPVEQAEPPSAGFAPVPVREAAAEEPPAPEPEAAEPAPEPETAEPEAATGAVAGIEMIPAAADKAAVAPEQREDAFPLWPSIGEPIVDEEPPDDGAFQGRHTEAARDAEWPPPLLLAGAPRVADRVRRAPAAPAKKKLREPRRPAAGLGWLLFLALLSGFFAWTSAEPVWLSAGHSSTGTATVVRCKGDGVLRRCIANFRSDAFTVDGTTIVGTDARVGEKVSARMVKPTSRIAYAGTNRGLQLRWGVGIGLTLLCGLLIVWVTGARRLPEKRSRRIATWLSLLGPVLLLVGFLGATF